MKTLLASAAGTPVVTVFYCTIISEGDIQKQENCSFTLQDLGAKGTFFIANKDFV